MPATRMKPARKPLLNTLALLGAAFYPLGMVTRIAAIKDQRARASPPTAGQLITTSPLRIDLMINQCLPPT